MFPLLVIFPFLNFRFYIVFITTDILCLLALFVLFRPPIELTLNHISPNHFVNSSVNDPSRKSGSSTLPELVFWRRKSAIKKLTCSSQKAR